MVSVDYDLIEFEPLAVRSAVVVVKVEVVFAGGVARERFDTPETVGARCLETFEKVGDVALVPVEEDAIRAGFRMKDKEAAVRGALVAGVDQERFATVPDVDFSVDFYASASEFREP